MRATRTALLLASFLGLAVSLISCAALPPASAASSLVAIWRATPTTTATPPAATATPALPQARPPATYVVAPGDTLWTLARRFGVDEATLARLNGITDPRQLATGRRLVLPAGPARADSIAGPPGGPPPITPEPPAASATPGIRVRAPVLLYHHINAPGSHVSNANTWTVTYEAFQEEMDYLAAHGYHTVRVVDLVAAIQAGHPLPEKPVVVSFDDGWTDCYDYALPILQQRGMVGSFFITVNYVGHVTGVMSWEQIKEMSAAGMEIGSHTLTHPYLTRLSAEKMAAEIGQSKALLEAQLGKPVEVLAYPFGLYNSDIAAETQRAGYKAALGLAKGRYVEAATLFQMRRYIVPFGADVSTFAAMLGD